MPLQMNVNAIPTAQPTLEQLLAQSCRKTSGAEVAFEKFLIQIKPFLRQRAALLIPNGCEVVDIEQQAVLNIWAGLSSYQIGRPVKPWVSRIVYNTAVSLHRRLANPLVMHNSALVERIAQSVVSEDGPVADPAKTLMELLDTLPDSAREMLELKHLHGMTLKQIARIHGISPGAVGNRIHYYLEVLRRKTSHTKHRSQLIAS